MKNIKKHLRTFIKKVFNFSSQENTMKKEKPIQFLQLLDPLRAKLTNMD